MALFAATSFLGAALLFLVEPMLAKLVLPAYGGSPTVWSTCTLFFQALLLAGYAYVHFSTNRLGGRRQPWLHIALLLVAVAVLPVALPSDPAPDPQGSAVGQLLWVLVLAAGIPFAVLATTGPLLQRWFSWTEHPRAGDPYFLYAASNVGSVVGLLGYPFLLEPLAGLSAQTRWWSLAYVAFALLVGACGITAARATRRTAGKAAHSPPPVPAESAPVPTAGTRLMWVAVAFLPSSLMLGVTTHVSTDIAAIPLFWTMPLALYLATFVVAFGRRTRRLPRQSTALASLFAILLLLVIAADVDLSVWQSVALDLLLLGSVGLAAHGRLSATRPDVEHLTGFYLLVSLGGVLGGLLNGLVAPLLLDRPLEYPLVAALVPLLLLGTFRRAEATRGRRWAVVRQPGLWIAGVLVVGLLVQEGSGPSVLFRDRTFFGSYRVSQGEDRRLLSHGTTLHGWEELAGRDRGQPTSYYTRGGPLGDLMLAYEGTTLLDRVAVVGMGVGTMAAYGDPGEQMDIYEIDPAVESIALEHFGYLRRARGDVRVVLGDGRLSLARAPRAAYGLIVLDAFSSDAIPAHLLTVEALRMYRSRLTRGGLLALHVTNRHLDLVPVVAAQARTLGMVALVRRDQVTEQPASPSTWVVLARRDRDLERLRTRPEWEAARPGGARVWTDDYSSLLQVLDVG